MKLVDFPMDGHACPLKFGSCKYDMTLSILILYQERLDEVVLSPCSDDMHTSGTLCIY
jgi:hypothetical protein